MLFRSMGFNGRFGGGWVSMGRFSGGLDYSSFGWVSMVASLLLIVEGVFFFFNFFYKNFFRLF